MTDITRNNFVTALKTLHIYPDVSRRNELVAAAAAVRRSHPTETSERLAGRLADACVIRVASLGAAGGLAGAIPGGGTLLQLSKEVGTAGAETWIVFRDLVETQLKVAALYGHDLNSPERENEVLIVWALASGALKVGKPLLTTAATKVAKAQFDKRITGEMLRRLNARLGATIFTKYGTKRGVVALGRLVPFGVGVLVGGAMSFALASGTMGAMRRYYGGLPGGDLVLV